MADFMTPEQVAALTNQAIPLGDEMVIQVDNVRDLSTTLQHTIAYDTIWADGVAVPLTLRRYRGDITYWQIQDKHKVDREWAVLRRLRLDGFPAPRPLARGVVDDEPFLIWMTTPANAWPENSENLVEQVKPTVPQLASILVQLHTLDHKGLNNEPLYQATVAGTLVRMLLWSRDMNNADLRAVIARLKPAVARLKSWPPALLHGNLHLNNILARHGQIVGLTSWDNAAIGDPRWDVMTAAHGLRSIDAGLAEQMVNWYETFSGRTIADRAFWWAMISVRLWAIKAWTHYAIKAGLVPEPLADWVADLDAVKTQAFADLATARL